MAIRFPDALPYLTRSEKNPPLHFGEKFMSPVMSFYRDGSYQSVFHRRLYVAFSRGIHFMSRVMSFFWNAIVTNFSLYQQPNDIPLFLLL